MKRAGYNASMGNESPLIRTRIAPSPTGIAHIGTAYYAVYNYAVAKKNNGEFIVRIEDTDKARFVAEAEQVIYDALDWLSIPYKEAPNIGGPHAPYRQSERLDIYKKFSEELLEKGHAYYCFCSSERLEKMREEQQKNKQQVMYDRLCRNVSLSEAKKRIEAGESHVVRMMIPDDEIIGWEDLVRGHIEFNSNTVDDQILIKSDGFPTYHLAVVSDDHLMEITHVMRGEEWISSTPKHILLYKYFGWGLPYFAHMPLLRNKDKSKMSKRKNDVSVFSYRDQGILPEALRNYLCLMGWSHPDGKDIFPYEEYINLFTIDRVQTTGPVFDMDKLRWMNGEYIRMLSVEELNDRLKKFNPDLEKISHSELIKIVTLAQSRMDTLKDFEAVAHHFFHEVPDWELTSDEKKIAVELETGFENLDNWDKDDIFAVMKSVMTEKNIRMNVLYKIMTGAERGLPLPESLVILGKETILKRLEMLT